MQRATFGRGRRALIGFNVSVIVALALAIWLAVNVIATRPAFRTVLDLSPQQRFSLSDESRQVIARVTADKDLKLEIHTFFDYTVVPEDPTRIHLRVIELTTDLLSQYAHFGGDQVRLIHHDIRGDIGGTRDAMQALQARREINCVVVRLGKKQRSLHILRDLADLDEPGGMGPGGPTQARLTVLRGYKGEEAITSAIQTLLEEGPSTIAYFTTGQDEPDLRDFRTVFGLGPLAQALGDIGIECRPIDLRKVGRVPDDAAVVAVVDPERTLEQEVAGALSGYLDRGGRLVVCVSMNRPVDMDLELGDVGKRLGFAYGSRLLCGAQVDQRNSGVSFGTDACRRIRATALNPQHPASENLAKRSQFPVLNNCRSIRVFAASDVLSEWLLSTPVGFECDWPPLYEPRYEPDRDKKPATFHVGYAFAPKDDKKWKAVALTGNPFALASFSSNQDLALSVFKWLTEKRQLVTVPTKRYVPRKLELKEPGQMSSIRWLLTAWLPGGLAVLGLAVLMYRRR